jgi:lipopolysaccharide biosynthesis glycosyltransferase
MDTKKNLIFLCVFNQENYLLLLNVLLESLSLYGNLQTNTDILIYTQSNFKEIIIKNNILLDKILFMINDNYNNIDLACKSRLDLFDFNCIGYYKKILYLDIDVVVPNDINVLFNLNLENKIYALEEGEINDDSSLWGKKLFTKEEIDSIEDKTAFSSGVMIFNNCLEIEELFKNIKQMIKEKPIFFYAYDQPYIIYNCFKYNLYNNKLLKDYVVFNLMDIEDNICIHHFSGGPGYYEKKIIRMSNFLDKLKKIKK